MTSAAGQGAQAARGTGTVTAVDPAAGTITINHGPIPEVNWPAMTMGFKATPEQVGSVKPGDRVAFDLRLQGGAGEITTIHKQ
jgi:Cu/Ag efflux protein CusF